MNSEFWNIFQWISNGFSDRIPIGIVPSPVVYKRPIVIFWFRMYWCSSRQESETGIEKNQKIFSRTLLIKQ
jgi:hypothetical protein